jgi:hypothetical protein
MMNKKMFLNCIGITLLFMVSCTSKKSSNETFAKDVDSSVVMDSIRSDMPPPPDSGKFDGHRPPPPPPDGKYSDGPPPPPPHGKGRPPHKTDNMRGFDPASEDDMDDNGMSRYMENNDEEGWD